MLTTSIQNPNSSLQEQFPNELLYKGPSLIICDRAHQDYQNFQAYELMRNNCLSKDKNRYPRSIDIESELYRINFYTDKCFYDNYKLDPRTMPGDNNLYKNRNALVHDYSYYENYQDTVWQSPRSISTTPGGVAKSPAEKFEDISWDLTAHRAATVDYSDAPNFATMNQCDAFHAYQRSRDCGGVSDPESAACGVGLTDEAIIRNGLLAQIGPYVPGIRAHKVERGVWKSGDTRMKQLQDGVLRQQLDTDWGKFKVVAKDGNCINQFQHFPSAPTPFPDERNRPGKYYEKTDGELDRIGSAGRHLRESEADTGASKIVRQVFPISPDADFYNFQKNCPQFQPERLFYNIGRNRIVPNKLNYTNFQSEWKGSNLKPK
jgi:hypothetical protein